ncbi:DUF3278 domain-containing protein [Lactiplantibacillus plantarum]|uniref:DUF3278 domain-containing protein n=1 Tax=Lactiplantibacillus plantarum TaxID=1590 RepID=UPI003F865888
MKAIMKWVWGLETEPDEVQAQELTVMNTKLLGVSMITNIVILLVPLIWDISKQQLSLPTLLICIMLIIISGYSIALTHSTMGHYVTDTEIGSDHEYREAMKHLELRTLLQTVVYLCIFTLLFVFGTSYILSEKPTFIDLIGAFVAAVVFGLFMFILNKSKIKRSY